MIQTAEKIIESVRALPKSERRKVFELIEVEKDKEENQNGDWKTKNEKFQRALRWIEENKEKFDGQFVLLEGDDLIAHGTDPKKLYETAREKGIETPFVKRVKAQNLPFGGW